MNDHWIFLIAHPIKKINASLSNKYILLSSYSTCIIKEMIHKVYIWSNDQIKDVILISCHLFFLSIIIS